MKLKKQERRYKDYLSINDRIWKIRKELEKRPKILLEKPYQKGWILYLDFRDDIKRREDYPKIKELFDQIHKEGYTNSVKFIKRIRSNRNLNNFPGVFNNHKYYIPQLCNIKESAYLKFNEYQKSWFIKDSYSFKWASFQGIKYYFNIPRYWLEIKSRPNMITHIYEQGGELQKELDFLRDKLMEYPEFSINWGKSYPRYKDRSKIRDKIVKFKKSEIEDITHEKVPREYYYY